MAKSEYADTKKILTHQRFRRRSPIPGMLKVIVRIILIILLFEVVRNVVSGMITHPVVARWGTIEKGFWTEALFLRNETIYTAPAAGKLTVTGVSGTMVPEGEVIATLDNGREGSVPKHALQSVAQYKTLKRELEVLTQDLNRVARELKDKQTILSKLIQRNQNAFAIKEDLNNLEQEKERILRNINQTDQAIQNLNSQAMDQNNDSVITAVKPGYLFYQYDDWENQLTPKDFPRITEEDLKRNFRLHRAALNVESGTFVAKIVDPFNQRIVVRVNAQEVGNPTPRTVWRIKMGEVQTKAVISEVAPPQPGGKDVLVALEDPGIGQSILPERRCRIFLVYRRNSGIVVPVQALNKKKGVTFVKLMKGDGYQEKTVRVIENDGERAIIEGIQFGDTIISR
ncbi:putative membrane fusion protein [Hydrogenispora ethanolica]|uniref:Putative membrane fusion protein n=2 Tax=Hydrogenispora ethanolica TaxID=1082276 RepID=A0A4R1RV08_HYDET|nr:putative membrane fusion protein [Hydrogenispora ethanolica]